MIIDGHKVDIFADSESIINKADELLITDPSWPWVHKMARLEEAAVDVKARAAVEVRSLDVMGVGSVMVGGAALAGLGALEMRRLIKRKNPKPTAKAVAMSSSETDCDACGGTQAKSPEATRGFVMDGLVFKEAGR